MYVKELESLVYMSNLMGSRPDYVQAGGGNTSVKFDNGYMAIKSSGCLLKEMKTDFGFVVINGEQMRQFYEANHGTSRDTNKESMEMAMASMININGEKASRPSIEAGFHSLLGKYVLHLHPVYTNVLMCSKGGVQKALDIARSAGITGMAVPYAMPGDALTKRIFAEMDVYLRDHRETPEVIFLKNHGIITHAESAERAIELMDTINRAIIDELNLPPFPTPAIEKTEGGYKSSNEWMKKCLAESDLASQLLTSPVYPDQLVYTANELSIGGGASSKIVIEGGEVLYRTGEKEATAIEETMTALVYLYKCIQDIGGELEVLSPEDCANILGWESEKYRKSLLSDY